MTLSISASFVLHTTFLFFYLIRHLTLIGFLVANHSSSLSPRKTQASAGKYLTVVIRWRQSGQGL